MNGTKLFLQHGEEGPKYDPYSYMEMTVHRKGKEVTLHSGFFYWVEINGQRVNEKHDNQGNTIVDPEVIFEKETGLTAQTFMKYYDKIQNTCKCGNRDTYASSGFPGETLYLCTKCNEVVSSDVNLRAIM